MPLSPPAGTVLAFDFGTRRLGVAVGETRLRLAHPLATISAQRNDDRFTAINALIDEWRPALLIVGLPTHADGTEHEMTAQARRFARRLEGRFKLPVELVDERFTTQEASAVLRESGLKSREHKSVRDRVAAQLILQAYFDRHVAS